MHAGERDYYTPGELGYGPDDNEYEPGADAPPDSPLCRCCDEPAATLSYSGLCEPCALPTGWYACRRCQEPTTYLSYRGPICEDCSGGPFDRPHYRPTPAPTTSTWGPGGTPRPVHPEGSR